MCIYVNRIWGWGGSVLTWCLSLAGAPAIATSSGEHVAGNARRSLKDLGQRPQRSETLDMLEQSSKNGDGGEDDDDLEYVGACTPTALEKTPGRLSSVAPTPKAAPIEVADSPKPIAATPRSRTPRTSKTSPSPQNVKRQLFGPMQKPLQKKPVAAPKPEGYWRLPA